MPDSSEIDNALLVKLGADATLIGLMPNLVHWDVAPAGSTRFVVVSLADEEDAQQFNQRSFEDALYQVKAVGKWIQGQAVPDVKGAAARIDALLEGATLTATGYTTMVILRERRIRFTEQDEADPTIQWLHRGGQYRVVMST